MAGREKLAYVSRVLGCVFVFFAGAFAWVFIGVVWWLSTFAACRKIGRGVAQIGAALGGFLAGWALLVGAYAAAEVGGWIVGRC